MDKLYITPKGWEIIRHYFKLTPREWQVAELMCEGKRGSTIATRLGMKKSTVKTHEKGIYRALGINAGNEGGKLAVFRIFMAKLYSVITTGVVTTENPEGGDNWKKPYGGKEGERL